MTTLSTAARRGDLKVEVYTPGACRGGEIVLIGGQEAKQPSTKGSLVFRFPLARGYPEGTTVRPLNEDEFLQSEGERLCLYRRGAEDDAHFVCYVDLMERETPGRAEDQGETYDRAYAEDLEERIQKIVEARLAS